MYGFLIVATLLVLAFKLFKYRINRKVLPWTELLKAAKDAESQEDLAAAERLLTEAIEYAANQKGLLWTQWQQLSRQRMAQVLFKSGQLDRTASLAFEVLQQGRAAT